MPCTRTTRSGYWYCQSAVSRRSNIDYGAMAESRTHDSFSRHSVVSGADSLADEPLWQCVKVTDLHSPEIGIQAVCIE